MKINILQQTFLSKVLAVVTVISLVISPVTPVIAQETVSTSTEVQTITPPSTITPPPTITYPTTENDTTAPQSQEVTQPSTITPPPTISEEQYFGTTTVPSLEQPFISPSTGTTSNGNVGDTAVSTGDATNTTTIVNSGNTNLAGTPSGSGGTPTQVTNTGNGANSTNSGAASTSNSSTTDQTNGAVVGNNLNSATVTGSNSTSFNNGNSSITSGDANTTGTIINTVNTNAAGVMVSEFNIVDDHTGDYILDFAANCVAGCGDESTVIANTDNGANSTNTATSSSTNTDTTNQTNNADLTNDMVLTADSGNNTASFNTGGDSSITTGDANLAATVLNLVNSNFTGNAVVGVVNIFADLIGDLIIPGGSSSCTTCSGTTNIANTDNGANSTNTASSNTTDSNDVAQVNNATIDNNIILSGNTGDNSSSFNTGGDSTVQTGDVDLTAQVLNMANMNLLGGDMWLVIVNKAGQWFGQIMGAPEGSTFAASSGTNLSQDANGQITATNTDNGAGSTNTATSNTTNNSTVAQNNNANIVNNINLNGNTGNNNSSYNTGGNSYIQTGDVTALVNLINFANLNIASGQTLKVVIVNVFDDFIGNIFTPDQKKEQISTSTNTPSDQSNSVTNENNHLGSSQNVNTLGQDKEKDNDNNNDQTDSVVADNSKTDTTVTGSVMANTSSSTTTNNNEFSSDNELLADARVAGLSDSTGGLVQAVSQESLTINLAWILLLAPILLAAILLRIRMKRNSKLNNKGYMASY